MTMKCYHLYIDNGISGAKMENRPGLQQMLNDLKNNKLDKIVVWKHKARS